MLPIDLNTIILAIISGLVTGVPATIIALRTNKAVNGKMAQLLQIEKGKAAAEATIIEKEAQSERASEAAKLQAQITDRRKGFAEAERAAAIKAAVDTALEIVERTGGMVKDSPKSPGSGKDVMEPATMDMSRQSPVKIKKE